MMRHGAIALMVAMCGLVPASLVLAADKDKEPEFTPAQAVTFAGMLAPSLVKVEIVAQFDKGESPDGGVGRWSSFRSWRSMSSFSPEGWASETPGWETLIKEERPQETGGYLVSPTRVFAEDPGLHPRFIKSIMVRFGDQVVPAKIGAYAVEQGGVFLDLAEPLKNAAPLKLDATKEPPFLVASYDKTSETWTTRVGPQRQGVIVASDGRKFMPAGNFAVVLDANGNPVTLLGDADLPIDGSWKTAPSAWKTLSAEEYLTLQKQVNGLSDAHLLRVTVNFRSPRSEGGGGMFGRARFMGGGDEDGESMTEWNGLCVLMDDQTVLVLAGMKPKSTARLDRIRVFLPDGTERTAKFEGSLKDYEAIVAKLDKPVSGAAKLSAAPITSHREKMLLRAEIAVKGETRTAYFTHARLEGFYTSYKGKIFPQTSAQSGGGGGRWGGGGLNYLHFLYTPTGELVAMPLGRREKVTTDARDRYSSWDSGDTMTPVGFVADVLKDGAKAYDPENRPLSEAEENRLAWIGAEMQAMDPELARANKIVDITNGGTSGGIISYIYKDSPAEKAGLKEGDVMLRLQVEGQPKPMEVSVEDNGMGGMMDQFWQHLDQMPAEYMDQMPKPWGSAENVLTRALTDIGFGTKFTAEVWRDGKVISVPMQVTQGPPHHEAAARMKSEGLGVTVRDITYEVRRYFQMKPEETGVIISKVERGSKSAVAGLKPMETIRSINDKPVANVKEFEEAIKAGGELKLQVKRMTTGRTVKVKADAASAAKKDDMVAEEPTPPKGE